MLTKVCWGITLLAAALAAVLGFVMARAATSAPQEAAAAAMALAIAVLPYVFTRAVEGLERPAVTIVRLERPDDRPKAAEVSERPAPPTIAPERNHVAGRAHDTTKPWDYDDARPR